MSKNNKEVDYLLKEMVSARPFVQPVLIRWCFCNSVCRRVWFSKEVVYYPLMEMVCAAAALSHCCSYMQFVCMGLFGASIMRYSVETVPLKQWTTQHTHTHNCTQVSITLQAGITKNERTNLETCITVHMHQKESAEDLLKKKVKDPSDFEWLKQVCLCVPFLMCLYWVRVEGKDGPLRVVHLFKAIVLQSGHVQRALAHTCTHTHTHRSASSGARTPSSSAHIISICILTHTQVCF